MPNEITDVVYDTYWLRDSEDHVKLIGTIGYGQPGNSIATLDDVPLGGPMSNQFNIDLGSNNALHKKELRIESLVTDKNANDIVSIHIQLIGGQKPMNWTAYKHPTVDNETYLLTVVIGLYK